MVEGPRTEISRKTLHDHIFFLITKKLHGDPKELKKDLHVLLPGMKDKSFKFLNPDTESEGMKSSVFGTLSA